MINFKEWLNQKQTNSSEIESIYGKAHIAVQIVQLYDPNLLKNISTIANLSSGAYGLYNSGEVQKELPPDVQQKLIYNGQIDKANINKIPNITLKKYFPELDETKIKEADTIRVNVKKILSRVSNPLEAVLQIASTIIHEATHATEMQTKGRTDESGPEQAEARFRRWAQANIKSITKKFPEINLPETFSTKSNIQTTNQAVNNGTNNQNASFLFYEVSNS